MTLHLIDDKTAPKSQRFRWQLKSRNGKIVSASSEGFSSAEECEQNVLRTFEGLDECTHYVGSYLCAKFTKPRARTRKVKP